MESIEGYRGVPHLVLPLLEDLHSQTGAKVHSGGKLSSRFNTSSGVRQGCVLASALFCIAIDWLLSQVIFLSDEVQAADCFNAVSNAAAPFGLRMSWTKTKVQNLGSGFPSSSLTVDGAIVEGVEEFVRLDALALSVIATGTWLGGWLAVTLRYCIKTAKPIRKLFRPSESPITLVS